MSRITPFALLAAFFVAAGLSAAPDPTIPPLQEIKKVKPNADAFKASSPRKPLVLRSAEEAGKVFPKEGVAAIQKKADFKQQVVLVFAWRGSGADKLETAVLESFPEQVVFTYKPGETDDLATHVRVFALRSNVKWRVK